jgi:hypothetical protein
MGENAPLTTSTDAKRPRRVVRQCRCAVREPSACRAWLASPIGQTVVLALICFCEQGTFNSLSSLAGGIDEATAASTTAAVYAVAVPASLASPLVVKRLGTRYSAMAGTLGYLVYAASMFGYSEGLIGGTAVVIGGALCGVGGSVFCTVQILRLTGVPAPEDEGTHLALFYPVPRARSELLVPEASLLNLTLCCSLSTWAPSWAA